MKNIITFVLICSFLFAAFSLSGCEKRENNEEILSSEEGVTTTSTDSIVTTYNAVTTEDNDNKQPEIKDVSELETNIDIWTLCAGKTFKEVCDLLGEYDKWSPNLVYPVRRLWTINGIPGDFWFKTSEEAETDEEGFHQLMLEYPSRHPESTEEEYFIRDNISTYINFDVMNADPAWFYFYNEEDYLYYQEWKNNLILYRIVFEDEEYFLNADSQY